MLVGRQIKNPMSGVDYLNEYEKTLLRKSSTSYMKINFGFQWRALNSTIVASVVMVTTVHRCSDVILA